MEKENLKPCECCGADDEVIEKYLPYAKEKLAHIIACDGDMEGKRNTPHYLNIILGEIISGEQFSQSCLAAAMKQNKYKGGQDYVQ